MLPSDLLQLLHTACHAGDSTLLELPSWSFVNHQWPMVPDTVVATVFLTVCGGGGWGDCWAMGAS